MQHWLDLLRAEVAAHNDAKGRGGIAKVARKLDYSRATVSLVIAGKYPGETGKVAQRVLEVLGKVDCPASQNQLPYAECQLMRTREAPTHNPMQMRWWRQCQTCSNNPQRDTHNDTNRIPVEELA